MVQAQVKVESQPVLYTPVHKGIRNRIFKISGDIGRLDFTRDEAVDKFKTDFASLVDYINFHHDSEHKYIHPLLANRVPGGAEKLEQDHQMIDHMMKNLTINLTNLREHPADFARLKAMGQEFYLAFNRFIAFFLEHLFEEEEHVQRSLWDLATREELVQTLAMMIGNQPPALVRESLQMILTGANIDEITGVFIPAKIGMPAPAFQAAAKMAEQMLSPEDWATLKARVGI